MRYFFLIVITLFVFSACDKVEVPASKQESLRAGRWKLDTTFTKKYNPAEAMYKYEGVTKQECQVDDYLLFRENFDGVHIPGENRCDASETAEMPFRWGLTDNDTKMYIYDGKSFFSQDINADVVEMTDGEFTITYNQYTTVTNDPRVDTVMYTMIFKKF